MTDTITVAIISAASALSGGLVTAFATRGLEKMRLRMALREKAEERRLSAAQDFLVAASAWLEWVTYMAREGEAARGDNDDVEENNARSKKRQEAYRQLLLLSSADLEKWLRKEYAPVEYEFNKHFTHALNNGKNPSEEAHELRRRLQKLLSEDLIARLRHEIATLREPHRHLH